MRLHFLTIFVLIGGCTSGNDPKNLSPKTSTSQPVLETSSKPQYPTEITEGHISYEDLQRRDSIEFAIALQMALDSARKYAVNTNIEQSWELMPADSAGFIEVHATSGRLFSNQHRYLLLRMSGLNTSHVNVYEVLNNSYRKLVQEVDENKELVSDSVFDINGDGWKDYVSYWYGKNGCCLKGFAFVNLYRPKSKTFSKAISFINPTFYPAERVIRGLTYGHPTQNELYKYRWRGERVDTIEYLFFKKDSEGIAIPQLLRARQRPGLVDPYGFELLPALPAEYRSVENLSWFIGDFSDNYKGLHLGGYQHWQEERRFPHPL